MKHSELPLYPKLSPIYNKIMQLAIAILLIIVLLYLWALGNERYQQTLNEHFHYISQQYLNQASIGVAALIEKDKKSASAYINELATQPWVKDISYYDETGQVIYRSQQQNSINDLFGLSLTESNTSSRFIPFVQELRSDKLDGYIRLTVERKLLIKQLIAAGAGQYRFLGLMLLMAGIVGFFLTRGFNRFSRQGYRYKKVVTPKTRL